MIYHRNRLTDALGSMQFLKDVIRLARSKPTEFEWCTVEVGWEERWRRCEACAGLVKCPHISFPVLFSLL